MPRSARFLSLFERLAALRTHMLPQEFSPLGEYSDAQRDAARGYRVLVHAEIEHYLEDRANEVRVAAVKSWKGTMQPNLTVLALLAYWNAEWPVSESVTFPPEKLPDKSEFTAITAAIDKASGSYMHHWKKNNGLKITNLRLMLRPIGIDVDRLDAAFLGNMDSFGATRGLIAHSAVANSREINPKDELACVEQIIAGLETLDDKLNQLIPATPLNVVAAEAAGAAATPPAETAAPVTADSDGEAPSPNAIS